MDSFLSLFKLWTSASLVLVSSFVSVAAVKVGIEKCSMTGPSACHSLADGNSIG